MAITQQQADAACTQHLASTGKHPSSRVLRDLLGSGSQTTILRLLNDWKARNPVQQAPMPTLPPEVANQFASLLQHAAIEARAPVEAELGALQAELELVLTANESLEAEIQTVTTARDDALKNAEIDALKMQQMVDAADELKERIERETAASEIARIETAKAQLKIESLQEQDKRNLAQIKMLEQRLEDERLASNDSARSAAVSRSKVEAAQAQKDELQTELSALKTEAKNEAKAAADAHASALAAMQQRLDAAQSDTAQALAAASQARERAAVAEARAAAIQESLLIATQSANASKDANPPV